jgi:tetratricopeptide (TPR) repeat protein
MERSYSFCFFLAIGVVLVAVSVRDADAQTRRIDTPFPDPGSAELRCRVLLPTGAPAGRAIRVTLNNETSPITTLFSDKNGEVTFKYLRAGRYTVDVEADAKRYDPVSGRATILPGRDGVISVYLRERMMGEAKPAGSIASISELAATIPPLARKEYERATKLARKGDSAGAIRGFERAISLFADYQKAHNDLGVQYFKTGRKQAAAEQFAIAIRLDSRAFNPRLNLGLLLIDMGDHTRAIEELTQAITIDDSQPAAHLHLGMALTETGDLQGAKKEFLAALLLGQKAFDVAYYRLGVVHARLGERSEAILALDQYLHKAPLGEFVAAAKDLREKLGR